jgi:hypothetical protein
VTCGLRRELSWPFALRYPLAMSIWQDDWHSIATEVEALRGAILGFIASIERVNHDIYKELTNRTFIPGFRAVEQRMRDFMRTHGVVIPAPAAEMLPRLLAEDAPAFTNAQGLAGAALLATWLTSICARIAPLLENEDVIHAHVVERAFLHLQRLIVADSSVRSVWQGAFDSGEIECERRGGVQLLHHGIYGAKMNSTGERTDLVLGTQLAVTDQLRRATSAVALTEWKIVRNVAQLDAVIDGARNQLVLYGRGSLAGFEIATIRFVVTVTEDLCAVRSDQFDQGHNVQAREHCREPLDAVAGGTQPLAGRLDEGAPQRVDARRTTLASYSRSAPQSGGGWWWSRSLGGIMISAYVVDRHGDRGPRTIEPLPARILHDSALLASTLAHRPGRGRLLAWACPDSVDTGYRAARSNSIGLM